MSINVGIKGLVLVKISNSDRQMCPVKIVSSIFDRVEEERLPICRHVVRVIPLMSTFYANLEGAKECAKELIDKHFGIEDVAGHVSYNAGTGASTFLGKRKLEAIDSADGPRPLEFCVQFKRRNHDTLTREEVQGAILELIPKGVVVNYRKPEVKRLTIP
jgi:hypothetical protein